MALNIVGIGLGVIAILVVVVWGGLQIRPAPFAPFAHGSPAAPQYQALPDNLPPPVQRYYEQTLPRNGAGEVQVPVITSAVISGRATMRIGGITMPARFRFAHDAGQHYRHYIETTLFGLPVFRVNEHFLDGRSRLELPFGVVENEPKIDQAANLGLWSESIWLPSVFLTDDRVRWEAVDAHTARLVVPFGHEEDSFIVRFDPQTGLVSLLESMRYKEATDRRKTLWLNQTLAWGTVGEWLLPVEASLIWLDDGTPWAVFQVEEIVYNVDVDGYLQQRGP